MVSFQKWSVATSFAIMWIGGTWPLSSTSRCEVKLHHTWSTTSSWSQTPDALNFAPLTPTSSLFREQTLDLATGVSGSWVQEVRTVYPPHCGNLIEFGHFKRLKGISVWRDRSVLVTLRFQCAVYKSIYLLTYLQCIEDIMYRSVVKTTIYNNMT